MALVDRLINDLLQEVKRLDPELRREINGSQGLFHVQMGYVSSAANEAIEQADWEKYENICVLVDKYFHPKQEELTALTNAVNVSFLEMLHLDGGAEGSNAQAWAHTLPKLQQGFQEMMHYLDSMAPKYPQHPTRKERFHARKKRQSRDAARTR